MKNNLKTFFICLFSILSLEGCSDFLEKYPQDAMSDKTFFKNENGLKFYVNKLYDGLIRHQSTRWESLNTANDDCVKSAPSSKLMQHANSGLAATKSSLWSGSYSSIRQINYFLENVYKIPTLTKVGRHYIGEGYFFRACKYFKLLKAFGAVPYIDKTLNVDSKELYRPRDSREFITEKILADLDSAIINLNWKGEGEAISGRINKESALLMKTRVALYEGSWEYYHGRKNTPFAVKGSDGTSFLKQVVSAGDMLIKRYGGNLYKGPIGKEYFNLFNQHDYTNIPGAFLYKTYSLQLGVFHNWESELSRGCAVSLTKKAVDSYLMKDGKPVDISSIKLKDETMNELCSQKDPRLSQTIWHPANGLFSDYWTGTPSTRNSSYPGLIQNQQSIPAYSGYRVIKGVAFDPISVNARAGEVSDLILRYEEALLNFAEAKAILGTITQEDLDCSVNYIRKRVNMPPMILGDIKNWNISYSEQNGYDSSASNILNEIRRERRVELMLEGLRYDDLSRWALLEEVFNGWKPLGAPVQEFLDYWNNSERVLAEGFAWVTPDLVVLKKGINYDSIDGLINPFYKNADFMEKSGRGYYINPDRDYLSAIPLEEIILYNDKANVELEQNPGWF